ncbi:MAG: RNA polymerase sigma factor [Leptospirales bacterium]|nr:RNA polymerase sigma factor [Leptospirales bacterium]
MDQLSENPDAGEALSVTSLLNHRSRLLAFVRRRVSDPDLAEDIFQDSLLRGLRQAPTFEDESSLLAWFHAVLRNAVIDTYRRNAADARKTQSATAMLGDILDPNDAAELCQCFLELLPALRPENRDLIEKMELGDEQPETAARRLGIKRETLKVRRFRARQELRQRLEESCRTCAKHGCLDCTCSK